jgi:hypothetical protein
MRFKIFGLIVVSGLLAGAFQPIRAQSLGEVARKEEERRKATKHPGKVYTNDNLVPVVVPADPSVVSTASPDGGPTPIPPGGTTQEIKSPETKTPADEDVPAKDQAYWSKRAKDLREQIDRDTTYAEALQTRVNSLTAEFTARDDPSQRTRIGIERQKSIGELDRLKKSLEDAKKAFSSLEDEARRAGAPPGWLR